jgi:AhpD family alkylhydroperoxidase
MTTRFSIAKLSPETFNAMVAVGKSQSGSPLEPALKELVKIRASQINGCAYCIDMHWKDARAAGETEQRLYGLSAWHESPYYTDRERAALLWTESLTFIHNDHAPDAIYEQVRAHFSEKEMSDLSWTIAAINAWNRVTIAARSPAGTYKPGVHQL